MAVGGGWGNGGGSFGTRGGSGGVDPGITQFEHVASLAAAAATTGEAGSCLGPSVLGFQRRASKKAGLCSWAGYSVWSGGTWLCTKNS